MALAVSSQSHFCGTPNGVWAYNRPVPLSCTITAQNAPAIAAQTECSAYDAWLTNRDELFTHLIAQANDIIDGVRVRQAELGAKLDRLKQKVSDHLAYNAFAKGLGIVALVVAIVLLSVVVAGAVSQQPASQRAAASMVFIVLGVGLLLLPMEFFTRKIYFDPERIRIVSAWKLPREIVWTDVVPFGFLPDKCEWRLVTKTFGTIKLSTMLAGLIHLQLIAQEKGKGVAT
jgi:hypothetical protein